MYRAYTSYLLFVNKVWPFSVKMLFWTSVSLCTRAAIQLRNDAFCLNWAHTEVLNLISSGKFNDICLLTYINWLNWFFLNLSFNRSLTLPSCLFLDIPIFTIFRVFSGLIETSVRFQKKTLSNRLSCDIQAFVQFTC